MVSPWELVALQHWIFYLLCIAGYLKQDWNLVSQSSVNSPQLYLIGQKCSQLDAPGVQPILLGWNGCALADTSGCDSHRRDRASTSRRVGKSSGEIEGHRGGWGRWPEKWGDNQAASFSSPFAITLWEIESSLFFSGVFLLQIVIFISPPPHLILNLAQVRGCAFVCSSLQLRTGCWITFGIETSSYWRSSPHFLSEISETSSHIFSLLCPLQNIFAEKQGWVWYVCSSVFAFTFGRKANTDHVYWWIQYSLYSSSCLYFIYFYCPEQT